MLSLLLLLTCMYIPLLSATEKDKQLKCILPPFPKHGVYEIIKPFRFKSRPGLIMESYQLKLSCDVGYSSIGSDTQTCFEDGRRIDTDFECLRCGVPAKHENVDQSSYNEEPGRISGGRRAEHAELPWHTAIYTKRRRPYMQICGGTLVTTNVVISAAHCFWNEFEKLMPVTDFAVAVGKLYRPWNEPHDQHAQKSDVAEVRIPPHFQGHVTNLQDDIALVVVTSPFNFTKYVRPACLDFDVDMDQTQLAPDTLGKVAGWGLTSEDGPPSPVLKEVELPVVDIKKCFEQSDPAFRSHITSDKICAGWTNGTAVCKGDSGGGLVIRGPPPTYTRFYLRGVVSGAPQNEHLCNVHTWASFTHLLPHEHFIKETLQEMSAKAVKASRLV